jgi:hypothetical protein
MIDEIESKPAKDEVGGTLMRGPWNHKEEL